MLSFSQFINEISDPEVYKSTRGSLVSHSYNLPGGSHKIVVQYSQVKDPSKENSNSWIVDFKRTKLNSQGKSVSSTFERSGMSSLSPKDRMSAILSVRHSINKFVGEHEPHRLMYQANSKKKQEFYGKGIVGPIISKYNKSNNYEEGHPHAAISTGSGMVFPKNEKT